MLKFQDTGDGIILYGTRTVIFMFMLFVMLKFQVIIYFQFSNRHFHELTSPQIIQFASCLAGEMTTL